MLSGVLTVLLQGHFVSVFCDCLVLYELFDSNLVEWWIEVSRVVDLIVSVVWERMNLLWYFIDVEVVDYIAKGMMWVPSYILDLVIWFWNHLINMWHEFIQLYVQMGILLRHGELDIKECELLISIDKDDLLPFRLWFPSRMVFQTSLWWFITGLVFCWLFRIMFRWLWHSFYSGFRNIGRCQLLICTPEFCSGWILDKGYCK